MRQSRSQFEAVAVAAGLTFFSGSAFGGHLCWFEGSILRAMAAAIDEERHGVQNSDNTPLAESVILEHTESDGVISIRPRDPPRGALIVAQGNGMSAARVVRNLAAVAYAGYSVSGMDYIQSHDAMPEGFAEILAAHRNWIARIRATHGDKPLVFYGTSFGGVILLASLDSLKSNESLILDGVPDYLPFFLACRTALDPARALKQLAGGVDSMNPGALLVVRNRNDRKVPPRDMTELSATAERAGGLISTLDGTHPFEKDDDSVSRAEVILRFMSSRIL